MISFNGSTKIISLSAGTTTLDIRDLWSRWIDWAATDDNSKYLPAFRTVGGDTIDETEGTLIPIYSFLLNGWKIKPQEASHTLNVTNGILLVEGGGDPFTNPDGSYVVRINYKQPVQAISFSTGGSSGGLTPEQAAQLADVAKIHGLVAGLPMTVSATSRNVGDISQTITQAGEEVTVARV